MEYVYLKYTTYNGFEYKNEMFKATSKQAAIDYIFDSCKYEFISIDGYTDEEEWNNFKGNKYNCFARGTY